MMLLQQYELIKDARKALFGYLNTISFELLQRQIPSYNDSSVCSLLKHVADVYLYWIRITVMQKQFDFDDQKTWENMEHVREYYTTVDDCITNFLISYPDENAIITSEVERRQAVLNINVLTFFTHVITHEFHHKGQILNMTRQLGLTPVDTDVIRL